MGISPSALPAAAAWCLSLWKKNKISFGVTMMAKFLSAGREREGKRASFHILLCLFLFCSCIYEGLRGRRRGKEIFWREKRRLRRLYTVVYYRSRIGERESGNQKANRENHALHRFRSAARLLYRIWQCSCHVALNCWRSWWVTTPLGRTPTAVLHQLVVFMM